MRSIHHEVSPRRCAPCGRAFTLVELLVVIAIIAVLVGLVLAVGAALGNTSSSTRTQNTIRILDNALAEWEQSADRRLSWGLDGTPTAGSIYDMQEDTPHVYLVSEVLRAISGSADVKAMLAQVDQAHLITYTNEAPEWIREGGLTTFQNLEPDPNSAGWQTDLTNWEGEETVLDGWDRPIRFVHPGRMWQVGDLLPGPDEDGTVRTPLENAYGPCVTGKGYFVSAGPDSAFGDASEQPEDDPKHQVSHDNIFSYQPEHIDVP